MEAGHVDAAIEEFKTAIYINPEGPPWMPMEGLARCYGEYLQDYETAISWIEAAIQATPSTVNIRFFHYRWLSKWNLYLERLEDAIDAAEVIYKESKACNDSMEPVARRIFEGITLYISALKAGARFERISLVVHELANRKSYAVNDPPVLVRLIGLGYDIFSDIGSAIEATGDSDFLSFFQNQLNEAIRLSEERPELKWDVLDLYRNVGLFRSRYATIDQEIATWQRFLELFDSDNPALRRPDWARLEAAKYLSELYYSTAVTSEESGISCTDIIVNLERLGRTDKISEDIDYYPAYSMSYPASLLGVWRKEHQDIDWRKCFYSAMLHAFQLLTDDDPDNDRWGYTFLGRTLLMSGDDINATIALGIAAVEFNVYNEALNTESRTESNAEDAVPVSPTLADQMPYQTKDDALEAKDTQLEPFQEPEMQANQAAPQEIIQTDATTARSNHKHTSSPSSDFPEKQDTQGNFLTEIEHQKIVVIPQETSPSNGTRILTDENPEAPICSNPEVEESTNVEYQHVQDSESSQVQNIVEEANRSNEVTDLSDGSSEVTPSIEICKTWKCDALCGNKNEERHFCTICSDMCFCRPCLERLRGQGFSRRFRACSAKHRFVRVFPLVQEARDILEELHKGRDDRTNLATSGHTRQKPELWSGTNRNEHSPFPYSLFRTLWRLLSKFVGVFVLGNDKF